MPASLLDRISASPSSNRLWEEAATPLCCTPNSCSRWTLVRRGCGQRTVLCRRRPRALVYQAGPTSEVLVQHSQRSECVLLRHRQALPRRVLLLPGLGWRYEPPLHQRPMVRGSHHLLDSLLLPGFFHTPIGLGLRCLALFAVARPTGTRRGHGHGRVGLGRGRLQGVLLLHRVEQELADPRLGLLLAKQLGQPRVHQVLVVADVAHVGLTELELKLLQHQIKLGDLSRKMLVA
mmetsp:Transcript_46724/g.100182  ORF Transcript_46724/g.100182 Transcript_46724/m.100182 type:complete len:234 (+) Transcript_46724:494-1195(+)